jgi:hypothetical protein
MKFNRRNVLIGLGSIAAGAGTLAGTGAFTSVTATRDAVVNVAGDAGALLSIQAADSPNGDAYVSTNSNGEVGLDLSTDNGSGVNPNAVTQIDEVLRVMNQGTQPVGFYVEDTDGNGSNSDVVTFEANGDSVEGSGNAVVLEVGESLVLDIEVNTEGEPDLSDTQILSSVTFYADYAQSQTAPGQDGVLYVSKTASDADFTSIGGALSAVSSGETVLVGEGTYEEGALTIGSDDVSIRAESDAAPTLVGGMNLGGEAATIAGMTIDGGANLAGNEEAGLYVPATNDHRIVGNTFTGPGANSSYTGIVLETNSGITGVSVVNNEFSSWLRGVYQNAQNEVGYEGNTFDANGVGIAGIDTDSIATVTRNVFKNNTIEGVGVSDAASAVISENDFELSNAAGVNNYGSTVVDARNNWWGASNGPSGGISDSDSSATADGSGVPLNQSQYSPSGPINFDPFRSAPVFSATVSLDASGNGDYTDFGTAVNALRPTDTLEVEPGTYAVTSTQTLPAGVTLRGVGGSPSILEKQGTGVGGGEGVVQISGGGTVVEDLEFDIGTNGTQPAGIKALSGALGSGESLTIRGNYLSRDPGFGNSGVSIAEQAAGSNVVVENNTLFQTAAIGVTVNTDVNVEIRANTIEEPYSEGIFTYPHQADKGNLTIENNEVIAPGQGTSASPEEDIKLLEVPNSINGVDPQAAGIPAEAAGNELENANPDADHVQVQDGDGATYDS